MLLILLFNTDIDGIEEEEEEEEEEIEEQENENNDNKERLFFHPMTSALLGGEAGSDLGPKSGIKSSPPHIDPVEKSPTMKLIKNK